MPEITCFVQLPEGDNSLTIILDTAISFEEFDNEMKEQLENCYKIKAEALKYSYIDEESDQVSFASNEELKEAFSQALKQPQEYFVILIDEIRRKPEEQPSQNQHSSQLPQSIPPPPSIPEVKEEEKKDDTQKPPKNHFEIEVDLEDVLNVKSLADILKLGTKLLKDCPLFDELEKEIKKQHENKEKRKEDASNPNPNPNIPPFSHPFINAFGGAMPFPFFPSCVVRDCKSNNQHTQPPHPPCNNNNNCKQQKPTKSQSPRVHPAVCDNCNMQIVGIRYKCLQCVDFDFCERCEAQTSQNALHNPQHVFAKIYNPRDVLNVRSAAPSPSPSCRGVRFPPFMCVKKPEMNVEKQPEPLPTSSDLKNNNNNSGNEQPSRNRFQCRVGSLQQRVDALESQISEIKQLLINNKKMNNEPRDEVKVEENIPVVQNVKIDSLVEEKESESLPEPPKLNDEEENSFRMLKEMGFDLSPSIVIENGGNINALVEQLFADL